MNKDTLKTFLQGALGAMTFGMYHQYTTNRIMEINNRSFEDKIAEQNAKIEKQHQDILELQKQLSEKRRWWW